MRAYVLGAGASYPIYPLGGALLDEIDQHIQKCSPCFNRFHYESDWPELKDWLEKNLNPLLRQAYLNKNIEQIFTVLDLADGLILNSYGSMLSASKKGVNEVKEAEARHTSFASEITEYRHARSKLLWAMEDFFLQRNYDDSKDFSSDRWKTLKRFGDFLQTDDVVITFNYDCTIERVLLELGKWSPSDGYGTELAFQRHEHDTTRVTFPPSKIKILHLHGAVGWYTPPVPIPAAAEIALDPVFLNGLGIDNVDISLPRRPPEDYQIMLHPSFLKSYGGQDRHNRIFHRLWKMAADALRKAENVTIIGYSLPPADSAVWTLLHTCCERGRTVVVNPSKNDLMNGFSALLEIPFLTKPMNLGEWLDSKSIS